MKRPLIFSFGFIFFLQTFTLCGQTSPGTVFGQSNTYFNSDLDSDSQLSSFHQLGFFFSERLVAGAHIRTQKTYPDRSGIENFEGNYSIFGRYYLAGTPSLRPFFQVEAGYGKIRKEIEDLNLIQKKTIWTYQLGAGFNWLLSPSGGFETRGVIQRLQVEEEKPVLSMNIQMRPQFFLPLSSLCTPFDHSLTQNRIMIGGRADFDLELNKIQNKALYIHLQPIVGLMIARQWMIGAGFTLGLQKPEEKVSLNWGVSPFARFYVNPDHQFKAFISTQVRLRTINTSEFTFDAEPGIGLNYFLTKHIALEGAAIYQMTNSVESPGGWVQELQGSLGLKIFLINE